MSIKLLEVSFILLQPLEQRGDSFQEADAWLPVEVRFYAAIVAHEDALVAGTRGSERFGCVQRKLLFHEREELEEREGALHTTTNVVDLPLCLVDVFDCAFICT